MRDMEHQRQIIDTFVNSVYVFDDRVVLNFNFTDDSKTISREEVLGSSAVDNAPSKKTPTRVSFFIWRQDWSNSFSSSGVFTLHTTASGRDVPSREMACPPTDWNSRPTRCSPAARAA